MAQAGGEKPSQMPFFLFLGFVFVLFYVLFILPQRKQQRQHDDMLKAVKPGDKIVTRGGVKGIVSQAREGEEFILLKIADGVKVEVARSSIERKLEEAPQ